MGSYWHDIDSGALTENNLKMSWWLLHEKNKRDAKLQELKDHFKSIDKDDDDRISKEDWYNALHKTGAKVTMEDVEKMFTELDKDFDGKLSWKEFIGEDRSISKGEFKKFCHRLTKDQVNAAFAKFDASGDGKLDYREFCDLMNSRDKQKR